MRSDDMVEGKRYLVRVSGENRVAKYLGKNKMSHYTWAKFKVVRGPELLCRFSDVLEVS